MKDILYIVMPAYNEEEIIDKSVNLVTNKINKLIEKKMIDKKSKLLVVDDGSRDNTLELLRKMKNEYLIIIKLSRNCGHQNAIYAGMMEAKKNADMVITIDADLQDDIDIIDEMVENCYEGNEIVYGVRNNRDTDTFFKRNTAILFYKFMQFLGVEIIINHADYRLMSKKSIQALEQYGESNLFLRGIIPQLGFKTSKVYYKRLEREAGVSKYNLKKMFSLALNGITSFSVKPIRLIISIGFILPFLFLVHIPSYNFLCLFFLFLILYLINQNRDNDIVIGIIVGLMCLTKQSIGVLVFIPFILFTKNKLKGFCAFLIPISICLIYLIFNNALDEFVNYCFLGLFDFGVKNSVFSIFTLFEFFILFYLLFNFFKARFKNKEILYILAFQIMSYPIFEIYHFLVSFIPVLYYFIKNLKSFHMNFIIFFIIYALFFVYLSTLKININKEDNFLYLLNNNSYMIEIIDEETKKISLYEKKYDYSFYIMTNAYFRKLYMNIPIGRFDFLFM